MATIHAEATATIDAPPRAVWAVFTDYHDAHARILPRGWTLRVETGGTGAGTVARVETRALGVTRPFRLTVTEPEPGRVLMETDAEAGTVTTFTVDPVDGGRRSRVTIATDLRTPGGVRGWLEGLISPVMMRRLFREELDNLARHLRESPSAGAGSAPTPS